METRGQRDVKEYQPTIGHYTMESVPRHIRIDHPDRQVFTQSGKKEFPPRMKYIWKGAEYNGTALLSEATGKTRTELMHYLNKNIPLDGCLIERKKKEIAVRYKGVVYQSISEFADAVNLSRDSAHAVVKKKKEYCGFCVEMV